MSAPFRLDAQLVDGAVGERIGQRLVDAPVLLDEGQAGERRRGDDHLEVVAAACAVDDVELRRVGEGRLEKRPQRLRAHGKECSGAATLGGARPRMWRNW